MPRTGHGRDGTRKTRGTETTAASPSRTVINQWHLYPKGGHHQGRVVLLGRLKVDSFLDNESFFILFVSHVMTKMYQDAQLMNT